MEKSIIFVSPILLTVVVIVIVVKRNGNNDSSLYSMSNSHRLAEINHNVVEIIYP